MHANDPDPIIEPEQDPDPDRRDPTPEYPAPWGGPSSLDELDGFDELDGYELDDPKRASLEAEGWR
jgi:hypothetical protein